MYNRLKSLYENIKLMDKYKIKIHSYLVDSSHFGQYLITRRAEENSKTIWVGKHDASPKNGVEESYYVQWRYNCGLDYGIRAFKSEIQLFPEEIPTDVTIQDILSELEKIESLVNHSAIREHQEEARKMKEHKKALEQALMKL